jgi:hypothetical protein
MSDYVPNSPSIDEDLVQLVLNCPELRELEIKLSRFNIFKALRADQNELRHSNMLAWLLDPDESHGLDDLFVRRWLMRVLHQASLTSVKSLGWVSPVAVDVLDIDRIEVHREQDNIDLLFTIQKRNGSTWTVCIENKVNSKQGNDQLQQYYEIVERRYAQSERRIYVFLTRNAEIPAHSEFISVTYLEVSQVLKSCLDERSSSIGPEPRLLIEHYYQLLSEDFMEESDASALARQIYLKHRRALDFIFEYKRDTIFDVTVALENLLKSQCHSLGIVSARTNKGRVRFLPKQWDVPQNDGGTAWGTPSRYLLCELSLWTKKVELHITSGRAPEAWAQKLWVRAAEPPFKQEWKTRPQYFIKPYKAKSNIAVESLADMAADDAARKIADWLAAELKQTTFVQAVENLADLLPELETA